MRLSVPIVAAVAFLIGCGSTAPTSVTARSGSHTALDRLFEPPASPRHEDAVRDSTRSTTGAPGPRYWTQHADYTLRARLDPDEKVLRGSGHIVYHNRSPHHLFSIHLELSLNVHAPGVVRNEAVETGRAMRLSRVAIDGVELTEDAQSGPRYAVSGTSLIVIPGRPIASGSETALELEWTVDIPAYGAAGRMGHDRDELFLLAYWYPTVAVYDDVEGWFTDPFRGSAEFYHGFGDYDVTIEIPQEWVVHATGTLVNDADVLRPEIRERLERARESDEVVRILDEELFDGGATLADSGETVAWRFSATQVPDFTFSATRHSLWDAARAPVGDCDGDGSVDYTLMHAVYRTDAPLWQRVVGYGQHALRFLSEYTGMPYPWPQMTAVEGTPIETGGMEYPMMTLIGNYNGRGDSSLYDVVAHEIAHQWIPMIVGSNERRYGWIDEGLTTFVENAAKSARRPGTVPRLPELQSYVLTARRGAESEIMTWSDFHHSGQSSVIAVYFKPATVFEALQTILGQETFMAAYRTFIREWAYRQPYPEDFFATFERVSRRDLGWFWRAWFYETWQLDQGITEVAERPGEIVVTVENIGAVPMPVRLEIELADGRILEETFDAETLWLDGETRAELLIPIDGPVRRVEIDPEMHFPDVERSNNVWWTRSPEGTSIPAGAPCC